MTLESYHRSWLSKHPDRTEQWLDLMIAQGFDVHHVDGNHDNDDPANLVLIETGDHMEVMHESGFLVKPLSRRKLYTVADILKLVISHYEDLQKRKSERAAVKRMKLIQYHLVKEKKVRPTFSVHDLEAPPTPRESIRT